MFTNGASIGRKNSATKEGPLFLLLLATEAEEAVLTILPTVPPFVELVGAFLPLETRLALVVAVAVDAEADADVGSTTRTMDLERSVFLQMYTDGLDRFSAG